MASMGQFFREVRVEMSKVAWPTQGQLITYTLVVIGISIALSVFLGVLDFGFQTILTKYLLK